MFGSGRRKLSEKYGLWVWLRGDYHNKSNHGVHFNRKLDLFLKSEAQHRFIVVYPELDWLNIFGRNYLDR
jgi:hypothetical protein